MGDPRLNQAIDRYRGEKGNLRLPLNEPIPYDLIARIVKARIAEQARKASPKHAGRSRPTRL